MGFREQRQYNDKVEDGEAGCHPDRHRDSNPGQLAAEKGSDNETKAEGYTDQSEGSCAFFWRCDVSEYGTCRGGCSTAHPIDQAGSEQKKEGQQRSSGPVLAHRDREQSEAQDGTTDADGDHGSAAEAITQGSDEWRRCELREGVAAS